MKLKVIVFAIPLFLVGCVNPYGKFYTDQTFGRAVVGDANVILPTGNPEIRSGLNVENDAISMREQNYDLLGYSSFNAGQISDSQLIEQGKQVHASVIYKYANYTGSTTTSVPLTVPTTNTVMVNSTGTLYGAGGVSTYSGTGYGTVTGSQTTYIPVTQHRSNYFATYWVKLRHSTFGTFAMDVPQELKKEIGSNKGYMVQAVVRDSPAYHADILRGDVILRIGDYDMISGKERFEAMHNNAGKEVEILYYRNGKKATKLVTFNNPPG